MSSSLLSSIDKVHDGSAHRIKDKEKAVLFREICVEKSPTRLALARGLGMRPSSVSEAVQELIDDGLILETNARPKDGLGRPQLILSARLHRYVAISIYVDSRELKGVLVTLGEEVIAEEVLVLKPETVNREMTAAIHHLLKLLKAQVPEGSELVGACLSLIGTVNSRTRIWMSAARWPRIHNLHLSPLEARVGFPLIIRRTNETELEYFLGCNPGTGTMTVLLLHWGFGIGSAVAIRGTLLTSSLGRFGEIGHTPSVHASGAPCLCGAKGCVESIAALWSLRAVLKSRFGEVPEDEKELAPLLGDAGLFRMPKVRTALQAVQDALLVLSMIFYPDRIVLSGPFTENPAVFQRLTKGLRRALPEHARNSSSFAFIPGGMPGCRRGGANPLFREALAQALRRRT
jgi:predicted NBD/HSP70 family sugar kinase